MPIQIPSGMSFYIKYCLEEQVSALVISVLDVNGKTVHKMTGMPSAAGAHMLGWSATGLKDGIYIIAVQGKDKNGEAFHAEMKLLRK